MGNFEFLIAFSSSSFIHHHVFTQLVRIYKEGSWQILITLVSSFITHSFILVKYFKVLYINLLYVIYVLENNLCSVENKRGNKFAYLLG